jgi:hypothetical protein
MLKMLGAIMLVPFAALLVLSCDDHPTAPEKPLSTTDAQESSAGLADRKAPPLAAPVVLAGVEVQALAAGVTTSSRSSVEVQCSTGKWPISGGWRVIGGETSAFSVQTSAPDAAGPDRGSWRVELLRTDGTGEWNLLAYAVCISMQAT